MHSINRYKLPSTQNALSTQMGMTCLLELVANWSLQEGKCPAKRRCLISMQCFCLCREQPGRKNTVGTAQWPPQCIIQGGGRPSRAVEAAAAGRPAAPNAPALAGCSRRGQPRMSSSRGGGRHQHQHQHQQGAARSSSSRSGGHPGGRCSWVAVLLLSLLLLQGGGGPLLPAAKVALYVQWGASLGLMMTEGGDVS